jgi:hypothetical protein
LPQNPSNLKSCSWHLLQLTDCQHRAEGNAIQAFNDEGIIVLYQFPNQC